MFAVAGTALIAAERTVDPTFLRRHIPSVEAAVSDVTTDTCRYRPVFGAGDTVATIMRGVARFGEITVSAGGVCRTVVYDGEEQALVVMEGSGALLDGAGTVRLRPGDFAYVPPGSAHAITAGSTASLRAYVMGFKVLAGSSERGKIELANLNDVPLQTVSGHPDSVLYRLLMGDRNSKRDRVAAGRTLTSLYIMEFKPGGTNFPHHHDSEEEIYVLLDGAGEMVAGSGMDGIEGRFQAKPGDAYFFRLNCTVGFYNGSSPSRILAVRSLYPRTR